MNPADWLRGRASAYVLDAEHIERAKERNGAITPEDRRIISAELEDAARDYEARGRLGSDRETRRE